MIGLDNLMKIDGVIAAGQFDERGNIIRAVGEFSDDLKEAIARMCLANNKHFDEQIETFDEISDFKFKPLNGWAVWGGDKAVCVVGRTGVIAKASRVDFNELMTALFMDEPTGARQIY